MIRSWMTEHHAHTREGWRCGPSDGRASVINLINCSNEGGSCQSQPDMVGFTCSYDPYPTAAAHMGRAQEF